MRGRQAETQDVASLRLDQIQVGITGISLSGAEGGAKGLADIDTEILRYAQNDKSRHLSGCIIHR